MGSYEKHSNLQQHGTPLCCASTVFGGHNKIAKGTVLTFSEPCMRAPSHLHQPQEELCYISLSKVICNLCFSVDPFRCDVRSDSSCIVTVFLGFNYRRFRAPAHWSARFVLVLANA